MSWIQSSDKYKILAILLTSSVLVSSAIVFPPVTTLDFPPQVLFDEFLHEGELFAFDLWVDAGVWIIFQIVSEVRTRIRVETWIESERATFRLGNSVDTRGVFKLRESSEGRFLYILLNPLLDGNVRAEIIDSSDSVVSAIETSSVQLWYLPLLFAAIVVDGKVGVTWLQTRWARRREHEKMRRQNDFNTDIRIPRTHIMLSFVRNLMARLGLADSE